MKLILVSLSVLLSGCASDYAVMKKKLEDYKNDLKKERADYITKEEREAVRYIELPQLPQS